MSNDNLVKVRLPVTDIEVEANYESVWAEPAGEDRFRLRNIPFIAEGFAPDDLVKASGNADNGWTVTEVVEPSRNSVLVCVCVSETESQNVIQDIAELTSRYEFGFDKEMLAIAVEGDLALRKVRKVLSAKERAGLLEYGELTLR